MFVCVGCSLFSHVKLIYMVFLEYVLLFTVFVCCVCFKRILKSVSRLILLLSIKLLVLALVGVAANESGNKTKRKTPVCVVSL